MYFSYLAKDQPSNIKCNKAINRTALTTSEVYKQDFSDWHFEVLLIQLRERVYGGFVVYQEGSSTSPEDYKELKKLLMLMSAVSDLKS